jgi:O-antigen ligase
MLLFGAGWAFAVSFFGAIYGSELLAIALLPTLKPLRLIETNADLRRVLTAYGLILLGLVISDIANATAFDLALKGWANPAVAAVSLIFVTAALGKDPVANVKYYLFASFLANLILGNGAYSVTGVGGVDSSWADISANENLLKVRVVPFLMPLLALTVFYLRKRWWLAAQLISLAAAVFLFSYDARSAGLVAFAMALAVAAFRRPRQINTKKLFTLLGVGLVGGYLAYVGYVYFSLNYNPEGHNARQLSIVSNPYNPVMLLGIGRPEWVVAPDVIAQKPILGYGSWAEDKDQRYALLRAILTNSVDVYDAVSGERKFWIPTHSVVLTSWIWGGLVGLFGAIFLIVTFLKILVKAMNARPEAMVFIAYFGISLLWDLFFSPIQSLRLTAPIALGFLIAVANHPSNRLPRSTDTLPL